MAKGVTKHPVMRADFNTDGTINIKFWGEGAVTNRMLSRMGDQAIRQLHIKHATERQARQKLEQAKEREIA